MDGPGANEIERSRSISKLVEETFVLYRRFPVLFLVLAAAVVVPYEAIVLIATGNGPFAHRSVGEGTSLILIAFDSLLIGPLISALHVHAIDDLRGDSRPRIGSVARRGLATLPVVSAAAIISTIGIALGFVALIVPGVVLSLRWSVVAQAAALGDDGWTGALKRSGRLTKGNYWHILGFLIALSLFAWVINFGIGQAFSRTTTTVPSFLVGTALQVVLRSITALGLALLFFDLSARAQPEGTFALDPPVADPSAGSGVQPDGHPLDPASYSDGDRPPGWYVNPDAPWRMRHWDAESRSWSRRTKKTPYETHSTWRDERWRRE